MIKLLSKYVVLDETPTDFTAEAELEALVSVGVLIFTTPLFLFYVKFTHPVVGWFG